MYYHTIVNPNVLVRDSEVNLRNYPFTVGDAILNRLTIKYSIITQSFTARPTVLNVLQRRSSPGRLDLEWGLLQKSSVHNRRRWIDEGGGGLGGRRRRCCCCCGGWRCCRDCCLGCCRLGCCSRGCDSGPWRFLVPVQRTKLKMT